MSLAWYLTVAALAAFLTLTGWLYTIEHRRYRRYRYGENAPIPGTTVGQRARAARPDGRTDS